MRRQLLPALRMLGVMTLLTGVLYTAAVTVAAQTLFEHRADGSLVAVDGDTVGSALIGQSFMGPTYFHPRPSAVEYDPALSGGSNYGPTNPDFLSAVGERARLYRETNGLAPDTPLPVDAVTASGSGLDPHISLANTRLQAFRVAEQRGIPVDQVLRLVDSQQNSTAVGYLSDPSINVLLLNIALDDQ
ncbi:MAG: K(+)-transporting ATPase subunit C [Acidimicrobiia bacterium]